MKWEYKTVKLGSTGLMGGKVDEAQLDRTMNELGAHSLTGLLALFYGSCHAA
jgi:hypothetical protein